MIKIHPKSDIQTKFIGDKTSIWQYVVVLEKAVIGKNCNICCHCYIENDVIISDNVTIKSGVYLWDGLRIGNNVFIGPNVTFINDKYPRAKRYEKTSEIIIEEGASIGAGSTVMGGIRIGKNAMIGAASFVNKDIPDNTLWYGNPAKFIKNL